MEKQNPAAVPEMGLPDALKLLQAITQAVLTGAAEVPPVTIRIGHETVTLGPIPVKVG